MAICLSTLFLSLCGLPYRERPSVIKSKISEARDLLTGWRTSYMDMRAKIEESGNDSRWEFDRKVLFEHSDYMSNVCQCVYDIAQVREASISADFIPFVTLHRASICSDLKNVFSTQI